MNRIDSPTFRPATQPFSEGFLDRCRQSLAAAMAKLAPPANGPSHRSTMCRPSFDTLESRIVPTTSYEFSSAAYFVSEGNGTASITLTRSGDIADAGAVAWATSDGTATAPDDYTSSSGTANFAAGLACTTISIPIIDDTIVDPGEYLNLSLSSPTYNGSTASLGSLASSTLTIDDNDDAGIFSFSLSSYSGTEDSGGVTITVTREPRGGMGLVSASVNYQTSDGTASAVSDYTSTSGTLNFSGTNDTLTFFVPFLFDFVSEPTEYLNLSLASPTNGGTLGLSTATLNIEDDLTVIYDVAVNQTLNAESGVGFLTPIPVAGNDSYAVASVTTGSGTSSIGSPITTSNGGTLTVSTDGSFSYAPAANFTGTDQFAITASYDGHTKMEAIKMRVGDEEYDSGFDEGYQSTTTLGALEYVSAASGAEQDATLSQVPFAMDVSSPAIIFQVFDRLVRLSELTVTRNVTIPDEGTTTLHLSLSNFKFWGAMDVVAQTAHVRRDLSTAVAYLFTQEAGVLGVEGFTRWFREDGEDPTEPDWTVVANKYAIILEELDDPLTTIYFTDNPENASWGEWTDEGEIDIGTYYWDGPPGMGYVTDRDRYGTIIHELSHDWANTSDWGYFNNPGAVDGYPIEWNGGTVHPTTAQLMDNADSYAGYLAQWYY